MTNPYDALIANDNPYDALIGNDTASRIKTNVAANAEVNPDVEARISAFAKKYDLPPDVVRVQMPEVEKVDKVQSLDYDALIKQPAVSALLADAEKSKIAGDDVANLQAIETEFQNRLRTGQASEGLIGGPEYRRQDTLKAWGPETPAIRADGLLAGAVAMPWFRGVLAIVDNTQTLGEAAYLGLQDARQFGIMAADETGIPGAIDAQRRTAAAAHNISAEIGITAQAYAAVEREKQRVPIPEKVQEGLAAINAASTLGEAVKALIAHPDAALHTTARSLTASGATLAGAGAAAAVFPPAAVGAAESLALRGLATFVTSGLTDYFSTLSERMTEAGMDANDPASVQRVLSDPDIMAKARQSALARAPIVGALDAISMAAAGKMIAGAAPTMASHLLRGTGEVAAQGTLAALGELGGQLADPNQHGIEWGNVVLEAVGELATGGGEIMINAADGVHAAHMREEQGKARALDAAASAQMLTQLAKLSQADKVLMRDQETFEAFVRQAAQDGPAETVYISANVLNQSGLSEQAAALSPAIAEQIQSATDMGDGLIAIPVEQFAARLAAPAEQAGLIEHLKFDPEGFTPAEAKVFEQQQGEQLKADIAQVFEQAAVQSVAMGDVAQVQESIKNMLVAAGRRERVADAESAVFAAYFATRASQRGISPSAAFAERGLSIRNGQQARGVAAPTVVHQEPTVNVMQRATQAFGLTDRDIDAAPPAQRAGVLAEAARLVGVTAQHANGVLSLPNLDGTRTDINTNEGSFAEQQQQLVDYLNNRAEGTNQRTLQQRTDDIVGAARRPRATLDDFAPAELPRLLDKDDWTVLTAADPHATKATDEENAAAMSALRADLEAAGYQFTDIVGSYGDVQPGFIITGIPEADAVALGRKYGQESVLTRRGLVYDDGRITPAKGTVEVFDTPPADFYTAVPSTGGFFSVDLDFDATYNQKDQTSTLDPNDPNILHQAQPHAVDLTGIHFSGGQRATLDGRAYGTGLKGAEAKRLAETQDARLHDRTYFYVDEGNGIRPEAGVGGFAHEAQLTNLYDAANDPLGLNDADTNKFESNVLNAGFSGYYVRNAFGRQGAAVVLGEASRAIPVKQVMMGGRQGDTAQAPTRYKRGLSAQDNNAMDIAAIQAVAPSAKLRSATFTVDMNEYEAARNAAKEQGIDLPEDKNEVFWQTMFHGGPARGIEKQGFKLNRIREGEGVAAYGHGIYFTEDSVVADKGYRAKLTAEGEQGQLYSIDLPEDTLLLDANKTLGEQPEIVAALGLTPSPLSTRPQMSWTGGQLYDAIASGRTNLGVGASAKATSEYLLAHGIKGLRYYGEHAKSADGKGTNNFVIWDEALMSPEAGIHTYYQQPAAPRGTFDPEHFVMLLMKGADWSTVMHEGAHFFFENDIVTAQDIVAKAERGEPLLPGEQQILSDVSALLRWHKVDGEIADQLAQWDAMAFEDKRQHHERTAESFERYMFEGEAPSLELSHVFQRLRGWFVRVYKSLKGLLAQRPEAGKLDDEVRAVFDRMLATDQQIELAQRARSLTPLFTDAETSGMSVQGFAAYQAMNAGAEADAVQDLQSRILGNMKWRANAHSRALRRIQRGVAAVRATTRAEVQTEVAAEPIYQAWTFLRAKRGETDDQGLPTGGRLSRSAVQAMGLPKEIMDKLEARHFLTEDGTSPELIALMFEGFTGADHFVRELAGAAPLRETVDAITEQRLLEEYGDAVTPEGAARAADEAIYNNERLRVLSAEDAALAKATGQPRVLLRAAKTYAAQIIGTRRVRDLKPQQYTAAASRAGLEAQRAYRKGDIKRAASEKRNQVLQSALAREALAARTESQTIVAYLRRFDKRSASIDPEYSDQIDKLLERFDFRQRSLKDIDRRAALNNFLAAKVEEGFAVDLPEFIVNEANIQNYRNLTVDDLRALNDAVKLIEHLGRLKNTLLTERKEKDFRKVESAVAAQIRTTAKRKPPLNRTPTSSIGKRWKQIKDFGAMHLRPALIARAMDGDVDGGAVTEHFIVTADERANWEADQTARATKTLAELLAPLRKLGQMSGTGTHFPSINRALNRQERLAMALNMGNDGNMQRLLDGEGWTIDQIAPVLQTITAQEWDAVQAIWDYVGSYREQIAAKERRVYGVEPKWVEAVPFTVVLPDGTTKELRGGYYPAKYDPLASQRAESHTEAEQSIDQLRGAYTSATTRRSFTKERSEKVVGQPVLLSFSVLYNGINEVIHDLAWHEWLIDTNKLLRSKDVDSAMRDGWGADIKAQFKQWSQNIAEGGRGAGAKGESWVTALRQNVGIAGLGFNAFTAVSQLLGLAGSVSRVGGKWVASGFAHYAANPRRATREAREMSVGMANRQRTQFRELNEISNIVQDRNRALTAFRQKAYVPMVFMQGIVDTITFHAGYNKALAAGHSHDGAVQLAYRGVVDSQGGGEIKDLSAIENAGEAAKLFTVFYNFMGTTNNMLYLKGRSANTPARKAHLALDAMLLLMVPAIGQEILRHMVTPGDNGDDEEKMARALAAQQLSFIMGLFVGVREFAPVANTLMGDKARPYTGPSGLRTVPDVLTFAQQTAQGEADAAFVRSAVNVAGDIFGLPVAQINRTIGGVRALSEGKTDNPAAAVFGYEGKR